MRTCPICGKELPEGTSTRRKYCSDECAKKGKYLAKKARLAAKKGFTPDPEAKPPVAPKAKEPKAAESKATKTSKKKKEAVALLDGQIRCGRCKLGFTPEGTEFVLGWKQDDNTDRLKAIKLCPHCASAFKSFMDLGKTVGQLVALEQ